MLRATVRWVRLHDSNRFLRHDDKPIGYFVGVLFEESLYCREFAGAAVIYKAEEHNSLMGQPVSIDVFFEILVQGDQNWILAKRPFKNCNVIFATAVVVNRKDVVALVTQPSDHGSANALVDEEFH